MTLIPVWPEAARWPNQNAVSEKNTSSKISPQIVGPELLRDNTYSLSRWTNIRHLMVWMTSLWNGIITSTKGVLHCLVGSLQWFSIPFGSLKIRWTIEYYRDTRTLGVNIEVWRPYKETKCQMNDKISIPRDYTWLEPTWHLNSTLLELISMSFSITLLPAPPPLFAENIVWFFVNFPERDKEEGQIYTNIQFWKRWRTSSTEPSE